MAEPLEINEFITIPTENLTWKAVRSSGPGGQHVNTTATCVELRFDLAGCTALSPSVKDRLSLLAGSRLVGGDTLLITSQLSRDQARNLDDAREKLRKLILRSLQPPKPRRPTAPTRASQERRMSEKNKRGQTKRIRTGKPDFD